MPEVMLYIRTEVQAKLIRRPTLNKVIGTSGQRKPQSSSCEKKLETYCKYGTSKKTLQHDGRCVNAEGSLLCARAIVMIEQVISME